MRPTRRLLALVLPLPLLALGCGDSIAPPADGAKTPAEAPVEAPRASTEAFGEQEAAPADDAPALSGGRSLTPEALVDLGDVDASPAGGGGVLTFESLYHDFGGVDDSRPLDHAYPFTNTGTGPLNVLTVKASCGCMTTELAKKTYAPGEGDVIKLSWEPKGHGRQSKTIDVVTDGRDAARQTLRAIADVRQLVQITPIPTSFGDLEVGQGGTLRLFANSADDEVVVHRVESSNPLVNATWSKGADAGVPQHDWVIDLVADPRLKKGRTFAKLSIELEVWSELYATRNRYVMEHNVTGTVVGKLKAEPHAFLVGLVPPKGEVRYSLVLQRMDAKPFTIQGTEVVGSPFGGLTVERTPVTVGGNHGFRLDLVGPVGDYEGHLGGKVVVRTDVPEDAEMIFPIMGKVGLPQK